VRAPGFQLGALGLAAGFVQFALRAPLLGRAPILWRMTFWLKLLMGLLPGAFALF
jgi:hypothetical protein